MNDNVSHSALVDGLALLCSHHGRPATIKRLSRNDDESLSINERVNGILTAEGFDTRVRRLGMDELHQALLPVLVSVKGDQWLLLIGIDGGHWSFRNPQTNGGTLSLSSPEFTETFTGEVVFASPAYRTSEWVGSFSNTHKGHWFWSLVRKHWRVFCEVGLAAMVANALAIAIALFAMQVYDRVIPSGAFDTLWVLGTGVLLAILMEALIRSIRLGMLETVGRHLDHRLGRRLFDQSIQLRLENRPATPGVMATQIREFESVRDFFTSASAALVSDLPFVLLFISVIALIGGNIAWVPVSAAFLLVLPGLCLQPVLSRLSREGLQESAYKNSLLLESFEGLESVKAAGAERRLSGLWGDLHDRLADTSFRLRRLTQYLGQWTGTLQQLTYVATVMAGAYLVDSGAMTVGGLIACTILVSRTVAPLGQINSMLARWQHVRAALASLNQLMETPTERPDDRQFVERTDMTGQYRFESVGWAPGEDSQWAIRVDQLSVRAGEHIALLGASGSGKSSLLRLMTGLVSPKAGQILLDDTNLNHIDPADRRAAIAYLPQDVTIFNGTLRDNLNPSLSSISDAQLMELVDALGLGDYVRALPLGLDTLLSGNRAVSGGQRQLIGLVRVLVQDPVVVILDEPTSALDQQTEDRVLKYLGQWLRGRTLVVATHKRSLLTLSDRILVLKGGQVVMDGPRDNLKVKTASDEQQGGVK